MSGIYAWLYYQLELKVLTMDTFVEMYLLVTMALLFHSQHIVSNILCTN